MEKWEYRYMDCRLLCSYEIEEKLNELGADRWEAFAVMNNFTILLKRKVA